MSTFVTNNNFIIKQPIITSTIKSFLFTIYLKTSIIIYKGNYFLKFAYTKHMSNIKILNFRRFVCENI